MIRFDQCQIHIVWCASKNNILIYNANNVGVTSECDAPESRYRDKVGNSHWSRHDRWGSSMLIPTAKDGPAFVQGFICRLEEAIERHSWSGKGRLSIASLADWEISSETCLEQQKLCETFPLSISIPGHLRILANQPSSSVSKLWTNIETLSWMKTDLPKHLQNALCSVIHALWQKRCSKFRSWRSDYLLQVHLVQEWFHQRQNGVKKN